MATTLGAVADRIGAALDPGSRATTITDVYHDSRDVRPGGLFVAIRGAAVDGHEFVDGAIASGAVAVIAEHALEADVPVLVVADARRAMAPASRVVHGDPDRRLSIVGVTGTNGKTTVVHICEAIWSAIDRSNGIVGTLGARFGGVPVPLARTTPESSDLQRLLGRMADAGVSSVAMEVSSHALDLHRADAIAFTAVGFTNLSQDHLDFHGTMDAYLASKQQLFEGGRAGRAVINVGDPAGRSTAAITPLPVTTVAVGLDADLRAGDLRSTPTGTEFSITADGVVLRAELPLVGSFNVANSLVAVGLAVADGVALDDAVAALSSVPPIRGRMEVVPHEGEFTVIVDYAHTPDAIDTVLAAVGEMGFRRRIVVMGAGGDRDALKRHEMGLRAGSRSDVTIVTNDNPRTEDPVAIARLVQEGALAAGRADVRVVLDRREAIGSAIRQAGPGDAVLILGKGHEPGQDIGGVVHPFDDRDVARSFLEVSA